MRLLAPLLLWLLPALAMAQQATPVPDGIWYEWVFVEVRQQVITRGESFGCRMPRQAFIDGSGARIEERVRGGYDIIDGYGCGLNSVIRCLSSECTWATFIYRRNPEPRPVERSPVTGMMRQLRPIAELDTRPILEFQRDGRALTAQVAGIMHGPLMRGIALTLVVLPLVVYAARTVVGILHEHALRSPWAASMPHERQCSLTQQGDGYDGQE